MSSSLICKMIQDIFFQYNSKQPVDDQLVKSCTGNKGALPDGQEVAVKRLSESTTQGLGQMKNELALIAKLQHKTMELISWPDPTIGPDPSCALIRDA